jgi:flagellar motor switch protein FliM
MKNRKIHQTSLDGLMATQVSDLPMIEQILRKFIIETKSGISESLNCKLEINLENTVKVESKEYIALFDSSAKHISNAIYLNEVNSNPIYILIEKVFLYKVIEIALGGQKLGTTLEVQNRVFSKIEETLIETIVAVINSKLQIALRQIDNNIKINHTKISYISSDLSIEGAHEAFLGRASIQISDIVSELDILIPYDVLLPMKSSLMKPFSNTNLIQSDIWRRHLQSAVLENELNLTVEIAVNQTLNAIQEMKVGDTLITDKDASKAFEIKVNGVKIYDCKIGKISEKIAVELIEGKF